MRVLGGLTAVFTAIVFVSLPGLALAANSEICQPRDDKQEASSVNSFFNQHLKGHEQYGFSRQLSGSAKARAKAFLEQRILDKKAELCADRLKLAEDIKSAPSRVTGGADCAGAVVVGLMDAYTTKLATTFDQNRRALLLLRDDHIKDLKRKLFDIAKGSAVEGTFRGQSLASAPQGVKFEWIKQEASRLAAEAHLIWGEAKPKENPLVMKNLVIAREAMVAKQERDAAKARYHTDGKLPAHCKMK